MFNIKIVELPEYKKFVIFTPAGKKYINCKYIPVIYDFSKSSINVGNKIGLSSLDHRIKDLQLTQEFFYFLLQIYSSWSLNIWNKIHQLGLYDEEQKSTEQKQNETKKAEDKLENRKIIESLFLHYSKKNINIYIKSGLYNEIFRHIPEVENDLKKYDEIINSMIDMKLVEFYDS